MGGEISQPVSRSGPYRLDEGSSSEPNRSGLVVLSQARELLAGGVAATAVVTGHCVALLAAGGPFAAYCYGKELATNPETYDPFHLRPGLEVTSICIDSLRDLYDRGCLKHCLIDNIPCLRRPGLNEEEPEEHFGRSAVLNEQQTFDWHMQLEEDLRKMPIVYKTEKLGSRVRIAKEEIPSFLLDNGISFMNAEDLAEHLKSNLSAQFPILECECISKYSMKGKQLVGSLVSSSDNMAGLKPGDARYRIKINQNFSEYLEDPKAYEQKLKEAIVEALGLDPTKIPAIKKHIKIENVRAGSIEVYVVVGIVVVVACAFMTALGYYWNREPDAKQPGPAGNQAAQQEQPQPAGPQAQQAQPEPAGPQAEQEQRTGHRAQQKQVAEQLFAQVASEQSGSSTSGSHTDETSGSNTRRRLTHVEMGSRGEDEWWIVGRLEETPQCYLPETLFRVPGDPRGYRTRTALELCENDKVEGKSEEITVMSKEVAWRNWWFTNWSGRPCYQVVRNRIYIGITSFIGVFLCTVSFWLLVCVFFLHPVSHPSQVFEPKKRSLRTLRTAQSEITVTSSHRVFVYENDGVCRSERPAKDLKEGDVVQCGQRRQALTKVIESERTTKAVFGVLLVIGPTLMTHDSSYRFDVLGAWTSEFVWLLSWQMQTKLNAHRSIRLVCD